MKVSIIIPCYNYEHYLAECLDSVLQQSWQNWEVWIIDDGSTDGTQLLALSYRKKDSRINYQYQTNKGLSNARNTGMYLSSGELIQFLDADDLISKDKLALQVVHFEQNPSLDISYCQTWYFHQDSPEKVFEDLALKNTTRHPLIEGSGFEVLQVLVKKNFTTVSSPLVKKSKIKELPSFNESVCNSEDWYFWLTCAIQGYYFQFLPDPMAYTKIRVHGDSMSQQKLKMYYGELQLRKWLQNQLEFAAIKPAEKEFLTILNQSQEAKLFEHTMLTGPLWDFGHLKIMYRLSSLKSLIKYHKKARKHQA